MIIQAGYDHCKSTLTVRGKTMTPVNKELEKLLADTFVLSLKTKNFHWNVTGPHFYSLHNMFEDQYTQLDTAIDDLAEGIRQGGDKVPASLKAYEDLAHIKSAASDLDASTMVKALSDDHQHMIDHITALLEDDSLELSPGAEDLLMGRLSEHKKTHWMLASSV
jgi:starvation-inducible DNA-binding protein